MNLLLNLSCISNDFLGKKITTQSGMVFWERNYLIMAILKPAWRSFSTNGRSSRALTIRSISEGDHEATWDAGLAVFCSWAIFWKTQLGIRLFSQPFSSHTFQLTIFSLNSLIQIFSDVLSNVGTTGKPSRMLDFGIITALPVAQRTIAIKALYNFVGT